MKRTCSTILALSLLLCVQYSRAQRPPATDLPNETKGVQLSISCLKPSYSTEEPITLDVRLRNKRPTELAFNEDRGQLRHVTFVVKDERGQDVPLRAFGDFVLNGPKPKKGVYYLSMRSDSVNISPHGVANCRYGLSRIFDMSLEGTYTITMRKDIPKRTGVGNVTVVSNTIRIQLMQPHDPAYNVWVSPKHHAPAGSEKVWRNRIPF